MRDKRRATRLSPFVAPCRIVQEGTSQPAYITELSALGARLTCDGPCPAEGARLVVEVKLARRALQPSHLPAVVVWTGTGVRGASAFGVSFDAVAEPDRSALDEAVEEFQKLAEKLS